MAHTLPTTYVVVLVLHYSLALFLGPLGRVVAGEELAVEELHPDHGEDGEEEHVDDEDVGHVLEGGEDAVEDGLERRHAVHHLEGAQHAEQLDGAKRLGVGGVPADVRM